jgi:hypothetical protein
MKESGTDATTLRSLEEQLLQPDIRSSPSHVANLLADDVLEFGSSGRSFDKAQIIAGLVDEQRRGPPAVRTARDFKVRKLAEGVALVTYRVVRRGLDGVEFHSLRSSIWKVLDGRWQMAFHQGTPIPRQS